MNITESFITAWNVISARAHNNAVDKGFWTSTNVGEKIALIHGEVSELLETIRDPIVGSKKIPEYSHSTEEAADIIIRLMDLCVHEGWNVAPAILAKMEYNKGRPRKHGRKF